MACSEAVFQKMVCKAIDGYCFRQVSSRRPVERKSVTSVICLASFGRKVVHIVFEKLHETRTVGPFRGFCHIVQVPDIEWIVSV